VREREIGETGRVRERERERDRERQRQREISGMGKEVSNSSEGL
jgi:hypothetical protein